MKKHACYLDFLRMLGAIAVVIIHSVGIFLPGETHPFWAMIPILMNWAVPVFVIISGSIFLGNDKEYTYRTMFPYIRRIFLCLCLFGSFYALLQLIFEKGMFEWTMLYEMLIRVVGGNTWEHMWYLYMILGIYLIIPIIKPFFKKCTKKELYATMVLFALLEAILPIITEITDLAIGFYLPFSGIYLFYLIAGKYIHDLMVTKKVIGTAFVLLGVSLVVLLFNIFLWKILSLNVLLLALLAITLCIVIKGIVTSSFSIILFFAKTSFGIYLLHPLFLNLVKKVFHLNLLEIVPILTIPLLCLVVFLLSSGTTWLLQKIPLVKKYLL